MKKSVLVLELVLFIILVFGLVVYCFRDQLPYEFYFGKEQEVETIESEPEQPEVIPETQEVFEEPSVEVPSKIVFTGDVEISTYVQDNYDASGVDGVVSSEIKDLLYNSAVTMINNEFCYSERGEQAPDKQFTFRVNPSYVNLLTDLGVDIAGLANNHVLDFGRDALTDTFTTLDTVGIDYTGSGKDLDDSAKLIVKEVNGKTYGFLASCHVIPVYDWNIECQAPGVFCFYDETELINRVKTASEEVDYLFVMVHWGVEHTEELVDYQINDAHALIDAGAYSVIGMHSHCLQPVEFYNGHAIFYSLGNFIFNTNISSGAAVEFDFDGDSPKVRIVPIVATNAKTDLAVKTNPDIFNYIEGISETVVIDNEGFINPK